MFDVVGNRCEIGAKTWENSKYTKSSAARKVPLNPKSCQYMQEFEKKLVVK